MKKIKIILVDDHNLFRRGLRACLSEVKNFQVVGEAGNGNDFFNLIKTQNVDVVLLDIQMPLLDGLEVSKILKSKKKYSKIKVIILSMHDERRFVNYLKEVIKVDGYLAKDAEPDKIEVGIKEVVKGNTYFPFNYKKDFLDFETNYSPISSDFFLSIRELAILNWLCEGLSPKEISHQSELDLNIIKGYILRFKEKFSVNNIKDIIEFVINHQIVKKNASVVRSVPKDTPNSK